MLGAAVTLVERHRSLRRSRTFLTDVHGRAPDHAQRRLTITGPPPDGDGSHNEVIRTPDRGYSVVGVTGRHVVQMKGEAMGRHVSSTPLDGRSALLTRTGSDAWGRAGRGRHVVRPPVIARLTDGAIPAPRPMPAGRPGAVARRPMSRELVAAPTDTPPATAEPGSPAALMLSSPTTWSLPSRAQPEQWSRPVDGGPVVKVQTRRRAKNAVIFVLVALQRLVGRQVGSW